MIYFTILRQVFRLIALAFGAMFLTMNFNFGWEFQTGIFLLGWAIMPNIISRRV